MKRALIFLGGIAFCVACGCRDDDSTVRSLRTVDRLFDDSLASDFSNTVFTDEVEAFRWVFRGQEDLDLWHLVGIEGKIGSAGQGLSLQTTSIDSHLVRKVHIDSDSIEKITVVFRGQPSKAAVELFWATKGARFRIGRKLSAFRSSRNPENGNVTYTFLLSDHPRWNGSIDRIRIDPTDQEGCSVGLVSVSGFKRIVDPVRYRELASKEYRIDQCGDIRNARVLLPGVPLSLRVDLPKRAKIRFAFGLQDGAAGPVALSARLMRGDVSKQVFNGFIEGTAPYECRWQEDVVDLSEFGDGEAELVFETQYEGDYGLSQGFPVLSQVEILAAVPEPSTPNIVLIVVDTLRADRLSLYGYERETSANIGAWAERAGVVFENTITAAPWTLPSHVSLFTGLDSLTHGMTTGDPIPLGLEMIAERFQEKGFRTAAFTGGGYLGEDYRLMQGFDSLAYWDTPRRKPAEAGNDLEAGIENAIDWLKQSGTQAPTQPFMLFFHTYEVHTPYREREPFFSQFHSGVDDEPLPPVKTSTQQVSSEEGFKTRKVLTALEPGGKPKYVPLPDRFIGLAGDLYDGGVAFADLHIGKLLGFLDESGLSENTIVVLTSDHGESLGEKGLAGHSSLEEWEIKIPLVFAGPGLEDFRGKRVEAQARLIDIMPTILELAGEGLPADIDGVSLLPAMRGATEGLPGDAITYASSSNFGLSLRRENNLKYEFNNSPWDPIYGDERLFLLEEDPLCDRNLAGFSAETSNLRSDLLERFNQTKAGLRMQFSNNFEGRMTVVLHGDLAKPLAVKSIEPQYEGLQWSNGKLRLTVREGTQRTLFFEGSPYDNFTVQCDFEDSRENPLRTRFRLEDPDDTWHVQFEEEAWKEVDGLVVGAQTGISAWVQGWPAEAVPAAAVDPETLEILRGLGYVE